MITQITFTQIRPALAVIVSLFALFGCGENSPSKESIVQAVFVRGEQSFDVKLAAQENVGDKVQPVWKSRLEVTRSAETPLYKNINARFHNVTLLQEVYPAGEVLRFNYIVNSTPFDESLKHRIIESNATNKAAIAVKQGLVATKAQWEQRSRGKVFIKNSDEYFVWKEKEQQAHMARLEAERQAVIKHRERMAKVVQRQMDLGKGLDMAMSGKSTLKCYLRLEGKIVPCEFGSYKTSSISQDKSRYKGFLSIDPKRTAQLDKNNLYSLPISYEATYYTNWSSNAADANAVKVTLSGKGLKAALGRYKYESLVEFSDERIADSTHIASTTDAAFNEGSWGTFYYKFSY